MLHLKTRTRMLALPLMALLFQSQFALAQAENAEANMTPDAAWTEILQTYGDDSADVTLFDYASLSQNSGDMSALDSYIKELAANPKTDNKETALPYWANLYNALTVQVVAQNWPVSSIKEIKSSTFSPGPWKRDLITVNGKKMSLNDIEHGTMRANYDEPRIHYMVNCASIGCPNLKLTAWESENLDAELDKAATKYVSSSRGASVSNGKLTVSSIFKWYEEDFGGNDAGVIAHLKQYGDSSLVSALKDVTKISDDEYNWSVNSK